MDKCKNLNVEKICDSYSNGYHSGFESESYCNPYIVNDCCYKAYSLGYKEGLANRIDTVELPSFLLRQAE